MKEEWKTIENYPNYEISNMGRVRALKYYSNILHAYRIGLKKPIQEYIKIKKEVLQNGKD